MNADNSQSGSAERANLSAFIGVYRRFQIMCRFARSVRGRRALLDAFAWAAYIENLGVWPGFAVSG